MNKEPARTGPKIRVTKPAIRPKKVEDLQSISTKTIEEHKYIYHCQYCRLKFTHNIHYFRHMMSNHETQQKEATFNCNECDIVFSKKTHLDLHCQTHHQIKSKSKCDACAITFKSRYCLRRHLKLKEIMQENCCLICQKKFTSKDGLAKHVRNKHTCKNIMYECDSCALKFKVKESLEIHLDRIHKRL